MERIEINEALAAVPLAVAKELGLPKDIINVDGGAIAIRSAPQAWCSRRDCCMPTVGDRLRRGIVTLCIGGGQGIALALETI